MNIIEDYPSHGKIKKSLRSIGTAGLRRLQEGDGDGTGEDTEGTDGVGDSGTGGGDGALG